MHMRVRVSLRDGRLCTLGCVVVACSVGVFDFQDPTGAYPATQVCVDVLHRGVHGCVAQRCALAWA